MSTVAEIERAIAALPAAQRKLLMSQLAQRKTRQHRATRAGRRALKAAAKPPLAGLPANLSTGTRERMKNLIAARHAANR